MAGVPLTAVALGQQEASLLADCEEELLPSLPAFVDNFRTSGAKSTHGHRPSSVFSCEEIELYNFDPSNAGRVRRLSTATTTTTSIGRPRHQSARPLTIDGHGSKDDITFVRRNVGTQDLASFLWTNRPSPQSWTSVPEKWHTIKEKPWYRRRKTTTPEQPVLRLPDCAVATKTPNGHWHIAIHIPTAKDLRTDQPRVEEIEESDAMSTISKRFSRFYSKGFIKSNKTYHQKRSDSLSTVPASNDVQPFKNLTHDVPQLTGSVMRTSSTSFPSRTFSSLEKAESATATMATAHVPGNSTAAAAQPSTSLPSPDLLLSYNTQHNNLVFPVHDSVESVKDNKIIDKIIDQRHQAISQESKGVAFRQKLITDFVQKKRARIIHISRICSMQAAEADLGTELFPEVLQSKKSSETLRPASSPSTASTSSAVPTVSTSIGFVTSTLGVSTPSNSLKKARAVTLQALEQAQRQEEDAKAVLSQVQDHARVTIPDLKTATNMAGTTLREAKALATTAMANADVAAAVMAAKQAAETQAAITVAERQYSTSKTQLDLLISSANARLAEVQTAARVASEKLHKIAVAEAEAVQERSQVEERERKKIAAEKKAKSDKLAKERDEAMAVAEAKAVADVRAAFARAEQEAAIKATSEAEAQERKLLKAVEEKPEDKAKTADSFANLPFTYTRDPEVCEIERRLREVWENHYNVMETLSAVVEGPVLSGPIQSPRRET